MKNKKSFFFRVPYFIVFFLIAINKKILKRMLNFKSFGRDFLNRFSFFGLFFHCFFFSSQCVLVYVYIWYLYILRPRMKRLSVIIITKWNDFYCNNNMMLTCVICSVVVKSLAIGLQHTGNVSNRVGREWVNKGFIYLLSRFPQTRASTAFSFCFGSVGLFCKSLRS